MKVYLRALELEDADLLVKWRNDIEITEMLGGNTLFISKYRETEWLKNIMLNDKNDIRLAICISEDNIHIGNVNLTSINWINRTLEFSIFIGNKNQWGKGYGTEASYLALDYAFNQININRVYLTVREDNLPAIKMYEKLGFNREGVLKEVIFKNNMYHNLIMMSFLKREYNAKC